MAKIFNLLFFMLMFVLGSCNNDIPEITIAKFIETSDKTILFDANGESKALYIYSNTEWKVTSSATWCIVSVSQGSDTAQVVIYVDKNTLAENRNAELWVEAETLQRITIEIRQSAADSLADNEQEEAEPEFADMRQISSIELSQLMGIAWNLGNSLEALSVNNGVLSGSETTWGNPVISQRLIDSIKAAGFNTVRIPVSWSHKIIDDYSYTIDPTWLNRVEEVVNYVLSNQMYAVINIHWDGGWMNQPFHNKQAEVNQKIDALWTQIAEYFIGYNDYLLFAGTNEVHVKDNYGAPSKENAEVQNSFNQAFVNAVRATGGRNKLRHLMVQGYNTNIDHTIKHFVLPNDIIEDRLMVEVHFYDPYDFALMETGSFKTQWGKPFAGGDVSNWGQESWVNEAFGKMKSNFIDKGIPVFLGEYGAIIRTNLQSGKQEHIDARNYYLEYVTQAAMDKGLVPCYWDNGHTGNNGFGLFNRSTGAQVYPDAINAIIKAK